MIQLGSKVLITKGEKKTYGKEVHGFLYPPTYVDCLNTFAIHLKRALLLSYIFLKGIAFQTKGSFMYFLENVLDFLLVFLCLLCELCELH